MYICIYEIIIHIIMDFKDRYSVVLYFVVNKIMNFAGSLLKPAVVQVFLYYICKLCFFFIIKCYIYLDFLNLL